MLFAFLFILLTAVASTAASFSAFSSVKLYYILGDILSILHMLPKKGML